MVLLNEFVPFDVSRDIVPHLIRSQNGTRETALRELVINAIDAGASNIRCVIGRREFIIEDNGSGFLSREQIMECFRVFGHGHHEETLPTHGRFRIGRGQIMAMAQVEWHSGPHKMHVNLNDPNNQRYGFHYGYDERDTVAGCKVSGVFFDDTQTFEHNKIIETLKNLVRYIPGNILTINGQKAGECQPVQWDYEDDDIKIRYNPSAHDSIQIYSQGVHVQDLQYHYFGFSADVVSKKALPLNIARNNIRTSDPVLQKIEKILNEKALLVAQEKESRNSLDEGSRRAMIRRLIVGELSLRDVFRMRLVKDCRGKNMTLYTLLSSSRPLTHTPNIRSRVAEVIANTKAANVLHADELRVWGVASLDEFIVTLRTAAARESSDWFLEQVDAVRSIPFDVIAQNFNATMNFLPEKDLTPQERAARAALQRGSKLMAHRLNKVMGNELIPRKIMIGVSDLALAWTDGVTFIALERHQLALFDHGVHGAVRISALLLAKYMTDLNDSEKVNHDFSYYQNFLDAVLLPQGADEILGHIASSMLTTYKSALLQQGLVAPRDIKQAESTYRSLRSNAVFGIAEHRRISEFMQAFLAPLPVHITTGKRTWEIRLKGGRDASKAVNRAIATLRNQVSELTGFEVVFRYGSQPAEYLERFREACRQYARHQGVHEEIIVSLLVEHDMESLNYHLFYGNLHRIALALCADPDSGLTAFEIAYYGFVCQGAANTLVLHIPSVGHGDTLRQEKMLAHIATPDARHETAIRSIKNLLQGLPEAERAGLMDTLLSAEGRVMLS